MRGSLAELPADDGLRGPDPYAFADGHAKSMAWGAIRKNDFAAFKIAKPDTTYNP